MEKNIAKLLLKIKAVKLSPNEPFTWASGWRSPIYCDNRKTLSYPDVRNELKYAFAETAQGHWEFDVVAGVATAGIPHGVLLADELDKPFVYVRSEAKKHGMKNMIEGEMRPGSRVLVIEDLISTGGSSLKAVESVREAGGVVVGVLAIFTYEFPDATDAFLDAGCELKTLTNYSALLEVACEMGYVKTEDLDTLRKWRESPSTWG